MFCNVFIGNVTVPLPGSIRARYILNVKDKKKINDKKRGFHAKNCSNR